MCTWQDGTVRTERMGTVRLSTLKSFIKIETKSVFSTVESNGEPVFAQIAIHCQTVTGTLSNRSHMYKKVEQYAYLVPQHKWG